MEINREVTVKLTVNDLEKMITEYLGTIGIHVKSIHFNVNGHESEHDYRGELPLEYRLDDVVYRGIEIKSN